ncbi:hypothetical protein ACIGEZ_19720 [Streptomyces sp. NPDC085481]|uniref:hypothetical protein n=1 Tax=Streptomyces sp. NPDC085481 TaxID=3365727 RepID=UPI0037D89882
MARDTPDASEPDAGLLTALARTHTTEDDDDQDDAAEQAFRDSLDALPDDVALLTGYTELCTSNCQ